MDLLPALGTLQDLVTLYPPTPIAMKCPKKGCSKRLRSQGIFFKSIFGKHFASGAKFERNLTSWRDMRMFIQWQVFVQGVFMQTLHFTAIL